MVKIIADTTSCLPVELAKQEGIYYVPQEIVIGEETYRDDYQMNATEFLKRQRSSPVLPKTSAPGPSFYGPVYEELKKTGDTGIVLVPSGKISGTLRGATVGAQDFDGVDIRIIDTGIVAGGLGALVLEANRMAKEGIPADEIVKQIEEMVQRHRVYFLVDTLEYLHKGGRIGTASHLIGSLLQMKPILTMKEGSVSSFESQRTHKRALARLKEIVLEQCPKGLQSHINITHGDALELANSLAAELAPALGLEVSQIPIMDLTPAILVHSGPGVISVAFYAA